MRSFHLFPIPWGYWVKHLLFPMPSQAATIIARIKQLNEIAITVSVNAEWSNWARNAGEPGECKSTDFNARCYEQQQDRFCKVLGDFGGLGCHQDNTPVITERIVPCFHGEGCLLRFSRPTLSQLGSFQNPLHDVPQLNSSSADVEAIML